MAKKEKKSGDPRSLARLYAVQALYQNDLTGRPVAEIVQDFQAREFILGDGDEDVSGIPDVDLFEGVLAAACDGAAPVDMLIADALSEKREVARLEAVLRAILRCGAGELQSNKDRSASVVINEYVDIAHAFYSGNEPGLVNGVLDSIAKSVRAGRKS